MMQPKGNNNWMYENMDYGSSAALAKNNFRQAVQYNEYMMQNRNQSNLKNGQYSNYYNHFMSTQNNTTYSNNYSNYSNYSNFSNYSYVNNQQGMQASQPVWGIHQAPYCFGPSCADHSNIPNAAPAKPIQYSHSSYERSSVSHNMGRLENPVMDSVSHVPNYNPHYNHQHNHQSNFENPHVSNSKVVHNKKRFMSETSKIQVRNVFELNNTVRNPADNNIAQRSNKPGQMNYFLNCVPGQNQNQIIPSVKQVENVCSGHRNFHHMKPDQHEGLKSVTKICPDMPNMNPVNMNRNNGYYCQNNAPNNLNLTQQSNHNPNMVEKIPRERIAFPEKNDAENAYRKKHASCMQEAVDAERVKKTLTFTIEQVKAQESAITATGIPKKSPAAQKSTKDLTDGETDESVFFTKKSGSKSKTVKKARKTQIEESQNGSNSQQVDEVEENTPEVITIKEEKEDWPSENSYTVETCVIENESINKNKDEDLYVIKSKFENKINKDKLTSLMGFLSHESLSNKRNTISQNSSAEKNCSPTPESVQFENNNNNKRKHDDSSLSHDRKKLTKRPSSGMISLALAKTIDAEDIESLKSIVLKECGLEPEEIDFRIQTSTFEETELSLKDTNEEEEVPTNIERDNTDRNGNVVERQSNPSAKKVIVKEVIETSAKKRRPSKRSSTDSVKEKNRVDVEMVDKIKTKDVGVQKISEPETCPVCLSKSNESEPEEVGDTIKTMKAFQSLKYHKCMSCDLTSPSNTFWINVITAELRCLNCFKKMVRKTEELLK